MSEIKFTKVSEIKLTCATQSTSINAEDWNFTFTFANPDLVLGERVFYNNEAKVSFTRLFKCPYGDCLSDTSGICKNCGGVKEIWYG